MHCGACGNSINLGDKFCMECGKSNIAKMKTQHDRIKLGENGNCQEIMIYSTVIFGLLITFLALMN